MGCFWERQKVLWILVPSWFFLHTFWWKKIVADVIVHFILFLRVSVPRTCKLHVTLLFLYGGDHIDSHLGMHGKHRHPWISSFVHLKDLVHLLCVTYLACNTNNWPHEKFNFSRFKTCNNRNGNCELNYFLNDTFSFLFLQCWRWFKQKYNAFYHKVHLDDETSQMVAFMNLQALIEWILNTE
jgi:hypothetical protein